MPATSYASVALCTAAVREGVLTIAGTRDQKMALPEGTWKVVNYTIDASAATGGSRTAMTASFGENSAAVNVTKDETVRLPFGAPFHPAVTAQRTKGEFRVFVRLSAAPFASDNSEPSVINL